MTVQFINDDFLPRMFMEGLTPFKEIKGVSHYMDDVGFTLAILGVEEQDKYLVALFGNEAVSPDNEGIYFFNDKNEAFQFFQQALSEHYDSDDNYEDITRGR